MSTDNSAMARARTARALFASSAQRRECSSAVLTALALIVSACGGATDANRPPVARIVVTPDSVAIPVASAATLSAHVLDADGHELSGRSIFWTAEVADVVSVDGNGRVSALAPGTSGVAASSEGKSAVASIIVRRRVVSTIRVSTTSLQLIAGQSSRITAEPLDASGQVIGERTVDFVTNNATVASVNASGLVTALAPGTANITASSGGQSAVVVVTVNPVPVASIDVTPPRDTIAVSQTTQFTATPRDATGSALGGRVVTWRSSDDNIAAVSSTGLVTGVAAGEATISAVSGTATGTARVFVRPRPVAAVVVSPAQATLAVGATLQLTVLITDAAGNPITNKTPTFTSDANAVARVSASGLVTAVAPGTAKISATSDNTSGSSTITVTQVPVASVKVDPAADTIVIGETTRLTATPLSATGASLTGRTVTWASGSPTIASVSSTGVVTGVAAGVALVLATVEGRIGTATILVQRVAVASVTIDPPSTTISVGGSAQLTPTARNASGVLVQSCPYTWTSTDDNVAVVSSNGRVVGLKSGSVQINAVCEGVTGSATVTVR
jgi:uncharacterized protein YjdB